MEGKALTQLDVQIAESRTRVWLAGATAVAAFIALIPGFPAVSAVMIPSVVLSVRDGVAAWRRLKRRAGR